MFPFLQVFSQLNPREFTTIPGDLPILPIPGCAIAGVAGEFGYVIWQEGTVRMQTVVIIDVVVQKEVDLRLRFPSQSVLMLTPGLMKGVQLANYGDVTFSVPHFFFSHLPSRYFSARFCKDGQYRLTTVCLTDDFICKWLNRNPALENIRTAVCDGKLYYSPQPGASPVLLDRTLRLQQIPYIPLMEDMLYTSLEELAEEACTILSRRSFHPLFSEEDMERITALKKFIDDHLGQHYSIPELARKVGLNELKLKVGFKALYGIGPFAYLREQRLLRAQRFLEQTRKPLKEIARDTGYSRVSNFCTAFRQQFGTTPRQCRIDFMERNQFPDA